MELCIDAIHAVQLDVLLLANRYTLIEQTPLDALFPLKLVSPTPVEPTP